MGKEIHQNIMRLASIHTGTFKLDGGAMFGVVPKSIWQTKNAPDEQNLCTWAMRCLLVEDGNRLILIDNGLGDKQSEKFFSYYQPQGPGITGALQQAGVSPDDITDVVLTHLHFDHCGGSLKWNSGKTFLEPNFPKALYWSHQAHWQHAMEPNPREKPSFLKENFEPLVALDQLKFIGDDLEISNNISVLLVDGHTEKMMCPMINYQGRKVYYVADLIPSSAHVPLNYVMAYDIRPLQTMEEKSRLLEQISAENSVLFFEHDLNVECATVTKNERGFTLNEVFELKEL